MVVSSATFLSAVLALSFFYARQETAGPGTFLSIAYYSVPFLLVNSAFGGYTAYAIAGEARRSK